VDGAQLREARPTALALISRGHRHVDVDEVGCAGSE
jgi:hypothetical protein